MSELMGVDELARDAAGSGPWTCPRCRRDNKAAWSQCPACESDRVGRLPAEREPARSTRRNNPVNLVLGLLVLVALVIGAFWVAQPMWDWVVDQWNALLLWVDART